MRIWLISCILLLCNFKVLFDQFLNLYWISTILIELFWLQRLINIIREFILIWVVHIEIIIWCIFWRDKPFFCINPVWMNKLVSITQRRSMRSISVWIYISKLISLMRLNWFHVSCTISFWCYFFIRISFLLKQVYLFLIRMFLLIFHICLCICLKRGNFIAEAR